MSGPFTWLFVLCLSIIRSFGKFKDDVVGSMNKIRLIFMISTLFSILGTPVLAGDGKPHPALLDPSKATEKAPDTFRVKMETTKGSFTIKVTREWAPLGADRFYNLVKMGYFKDVAFYRALDGFMTQFGFSGDPAINAAWKNATIKDDPKNKSNTVGRITFANRMRPNTRTCQLFINTVNNSDLDNMGFQPFGELEGDGLEIVKSLFTGYGEGYPRGRGPSQARIESEGNNYLKREYPKLDYIKNAEIID